MLAPSTPDRLAPLVCPILVGRDDLLALADRRRAEAGRGRGALLFLAGEAGIGKTRLLEAAERRARGDGFTVASGAAFPRDLEEPAGALLDLARAMTRLPATRSAGEALTMRLTDAGATATGDRHRAHRVLVLDAADLLAGAAQQRPLLLALEDLHWADDLTLEILAVLARRLRELPMIVVATYRSDELYPRIPMRDWRSRLLAGRLAEEARLTRLDRDGTATMTTLILGTGLPAPADLVDVVHQRSDGVPLHVEELVGVMRHTGALTDTTGGGQVGMTLVPDTLEDAVLRRAARLSPATRKVADAAAVVGRSLDPELLATVMGRDADRLAAPLAELERAFFVTQAAEGRLDFRHALIRDALYRSVPVPTRRRLHGRVADAARAAGSGPAFLSVHLEEAGRRDEAFGEAVAGARLAAAMSSHREALELLVRARRNMPASIAPTEAGRVLAALAAEAAAADRNELADEAYTAAAASFRDSGDVLAGAGLVPGHVSVRHLLGEDFAGRERRLVQALDGLPDAPGATPVRARLLAGLAAANMLDRRLEAAIDHGERGRALAIAAGDTATELDLAATVGSCLVFAGHMDEGWRMLASAVERAREGELEAQAARGYRMIASCASVLVEYDLAERWLDEGIAYAERVELWNHRHYLAAHLAHVRWATGDWDGAEAAAAHALSDGRGGITTRITALHVLGYHALGRGDLERARELLGEAREVGERMAELQRLSPALWGLAEAALLGGDTAVAIDWCRRGEEHSARVRDAAYLFPFVVTGTRAHLAAGDPGGAAAWLERTAAAVTERSIPGTLPALDHARGLLELARGETGQARRSLELACAGWQKRRRAWEGTWATIDLAECLARSNRPAQAALLADDAAARAAALRSGPLARRADALVHRLRARSPAAASWAPLTAREFEVARLIADGRTNAAIAAELGVAPRTVTAHVEHILAKLGVGRRTEVAAWVERTVPGRRDRG